MADRPHPQTTASDVPLTAETDLDALFTAILGRDADSSLSRASGESGPLLPTPVVTAPESRPSAASPLPTPASRPSAPPPVVLPTRSRLVDSALVDFARADVARPDLAFAEAERGPLVHPLSPPPETPLPDDSSATVIDDFGGDDRTPPWRTAASSPWTVVALAAIAVGTLGMIVRSVGRAGDSPAGPTAVVAPATPSAATPSTTETTPAPSTTPASSPAPVSSTSSAALPRSAPPPRPTSALPPRPAALPVTPPPSLGTRVAAGIIVAGPSPTSAAREADVVSPPGTPAVTAPAQEPAPAPEAVPATSPAPAAVTPPPPSPSADVVPDAAATAPSAARETPAPAGASAQAATPAPVPRAIGVTRPARIIERPAISLRSPGPPGEVSVQVTVDASGVVSAVRTLSGPMALRGAAEAAAKQTRFEPALRAGVPVASVVTVVYAISPR